MTPDEFLAECRRLSKLSKEKDGGVHYLLKNGKPKELPEYYPGYRKLVSAYQQAYDHAHGEFPEQLISHNKPLQTDEEFAYVKNTYQAITKDTFYEFSATVKRSLMNGRIDFRREKDSELSQNFKKYIREEIKGFDSLYLFIQAMSDQKLIDGNGIVGIWIEADTIENEEGEEIITGYAKPYPVIYDVSRVVWMKDDEYIVETARKSRLSYGNSTSEIGRVYRYFGKEWIYEAEQVGKYTDDDFAIVFEYDHNIGYAPALRMMGNPLVITNSLHYDSVFNLAVPHLNNAALDSTNIKLIKNKNVYPTRVIVREKCTFHDENGSCDNGIFRMNMTEDDDTPRIKTCPNCRGTGYHGVFGPLSELVVNNTPSGIDDDRPSSVNASNAMAYVSPPIETPKFLSEEIEKELLKAEQVLHLKSEPRESGDISATEKDRDAKNTEAFLKPISDQIWHIVDYLVGCIGIIRYRDQYESIKPDIISPNSFDIMTPADYLANVQSAKEAGMPSIVVQSLTSEYLNSVMKQNPMEGEKYALAVAIDRLIDSTIEQVHLMLARNLVQPWEAVLHSSIMYLIDQAILEDEAFMEKELSEKKAILKAMAQALVVQTGTGIALPPPAEI